MDPTAPLPTQPQTATADLPGTGRPAPSPPEPFSDDEATPPAGNSGPDVGAFFKAHILPALFVFLIPAIAAWFFSYAETATDEAALVSIKADLAKTNLAETKKLEIVNFFKKTPPSKLLASDDPNLAKYQEMFAPAKARYAIFRWMQRIAWICLLTTAATLLIVGISVAFSFRSNAAQYYALRLGWPVLRTSAAIQVLGQGVLAVTLSFWITVLWTQSYFPKLIIMIGILAACAVIALCRAIFAKPDEAFVLRGELLGESDAPTLWQRIREMAAKLSTAPPDRIVVGVEPNFFVTEHPVTMASGRQEGRTLYLSLPMLKILRMEEADAILGHELAHFSGEDTLWSRKIAPLRAKFALYLQALGHGLSLLIAHFMHAFWKLYGLSMNRLSREREFRADQIGAELTSKEAAKRALIKVTSYFDFRSATEKSILQQETVDNRLDLALKLEQGYPGFLASFSQSAKAIEERVPHPFDSHPKLSNRLEHLGFDPRGALLDRAVQEPVGDSWYRAIATAEDIEKQLWAEQQKAFQAYHQQDLLWRILPTSAEHIALLREHFPRVTFPKKKSGSGEAVVEFDRVQLSEWSAPLLFADIHKAEMQTTWGRNNLLLTHSGRNGAGTKAKIPLREYAKSDPNLLAAFGRYYSRHKTAEARQRQGV